MATLTTTQRTDLQADLGIGSDEAVFTNDELDRLYTRADADYDTSVYLAYRQLLANANKFHDYTAGQTKVQKSQVREHLRDMVDFWKEEAMTRANQVRFLGMNEIPPRHKDEPD
jgi:uncharacterized protein (DUF885 family)